MKRTNAHGTREIDLMANHATITLMFINSSEWETMHFEFNRPKSEISEHWCRGSHPVEVSVIALLIYMPKERG
jgi:hypothetical protein